MVSPGLMIIRKAGLFQISCGHSTVDDRQDTEIHMDSVETLPGTVHRTFARQSLMISHIKQVLISLGPDFLVLTENKNK